MTSKERIHKLLNFNTPDRIGIHDTFLDDTLVKWRDVGMPDNISPQDYFGFDFEIQDIDSAVKSSTPGKAKMEKFQIISFSEPFQRLCSSRGRENVLREMAYNPKRFSSDLIIETENIINSFHRIIRQRKQFDAAWAFGDLAYNKGMFFSPRIYKKLLLPLHREIFKYLNSESIYVFFHSDGNVMDLLPHLIDAGVRAFHPLEENSGMNIGKLINDYKDDMVFMGHMDIGRLISGGSFDKLRERIEILKEKSFYIYHADYPIPPNIAFAEYKDAIEFLKEVGSY
ncbi:MAG: hypothetical protein HQ575_04595 [Candidatus Omnitrophica bacterium]|nr:hypothetical protein [Candidatus Omnitrophota bacterium]